MELLSDQGLRLDGRRVDELREIRCKLGVFDQPDGSAYLEQGNTKVLAAVYGPHQVRGGSRLKGLNEGAVVNCQYSMATFSTGERKRRPRGDRKSQEMTSHLNQALSAAIKTELYHKSSQIDVYLEVLQADGGNYCACVNAATMALIDAGIPINEYIIGCTASLANGSVPMVDISHLEETTGGPNLTVVVMPLSGQIVAAEMTDRFHVDHLEKVLGTALEGCQQIYKKLDQYVRDYLSDTGCASSWGQNLNT